MRSQRLLAVVVVSLLVAALAAPAAAGRVLRPDLAGSVPWIEVGFLRPSFDAGPIDFSTFSGNWLVSAALPVGGSALLVELPVAHYAYEASVYDGFYETTFELDESGTEVGNLYVGVQAGTPEGRPSWIGGRLGVHLPTAGRERGYDSAEVFFLALSADVLSLHRYAPDVLTFEASFLTQIAPAVGTTLGIEIGPHFLVPTGDLHGDAEFFLHQSAFLALGAPPLSVFLEVAGHVWLTTDGAEPMIDHVAAVGAGFDLGMVEPTLYLSLPLSEPMNETVDYAIGLQCRLDLGR